MPKVLEYFKTVLGENVLYLVLESEKNELVLLLNDSSTQREESKREKLQASLWGNIQGQEYYPHGEIMQQIREEMEQEDSPIITAAHYSFCGGNRASAHLSTLLPLPHQVKIHFYGHAHIGDYAWAKENAYRRISCVDWHDIPQINVSSFEHIRGKFCRSVFLHIYEDHSFGIFFRNHNARKFSEVYFPAKEKHS